MSTPRRARINWNGVPGWLVLFGNNVAFAVQDNPAIRMDGLPVVYFPWDESKFGGQIIEWIDEEPSN